MNKGLLKILALGLLVTSCGISDGPSRTESIDGGSNDSDPVAGTSLVFSNIASTSLTVTWGPASDDTSPTAELSYKLVYSTVSSEIDSIEEVAALSGASVLMDWTANTTTASITELTQLTQYYFAVLVRDSAANKALYSPVGQATSADGDPVTGTAISFTNVDYTSLTVNWGQASDDTTAAAQLEYKLVYSATSAAIDTVSEVDALTGASVLLDWTANTLTDNVSGLTQSTQYYFAVLVRDTLGNKSLYNPAGQITPTPPDTSNLLSHWKFDNSIEDVHGANDFTQQGAATSYSTSTVKFGTHSLGFNGVDQYLTTNFDLNNVANFTMAGWVYMESYPTFNVTPPTKVGFWGQNDLIEMGLVYETGLLRLCLWVNGSSNVCDTKQFPIQQWVHVAITGSTTTGTQVFYNGVRVASSTAITAASNAYKLNVGHGVWSPAGDGVNPEEFFHGFIDELAIWERVLDDDEIEDLANL